LIDFLARRYAVRPSTLLGMPDQSPMALNLDAWIALESEQRNRRGETESEDIPSIEDFDIGIHTGR